MSNAMKTLNSETYVNSYAVVKAVIITFLFTVGTFGLLSYQYAIGSETYFLEELEIIKAENAIDIEELKEKHVKEIIALTEESNIEKAMLTQDRDIIKAKLDSALVPEKDIATAANNHVVKPAKEKAIVAYDYTKEVSGKAYEYTKEKSEQVYDKIVSVFNQYN
jgi:hypothetical protein